MSDHAQRTAAFRDALARGRKASEAFYRGESGPYKNLWSQAEDVTLFGAFGPCKTGWPALSETFDWVASRYHDGRVRLENQATFVGTDVAYTVSYEHGQLRLDDQADRSHTIRVTHIYRWEGDQWKLAHRHGDFAPLDESPATSAKST